MITIEKYEELENSGLDITHYFLLQRIQNSLPLPTSKNTKGRLNLLEKLGFIKDGSLTVFGKNILDGIVDESIKPIIDAERIKALPFAEWVNTVYNDCQKKITELTGKKQVRPIIRGTTYSFLCNDVDFFNKLFEVFKKYKLKDRDKVHKCLINFIQRCHKQNTWTPLMKYYIIKDGQSTLVTDIQSIDEDDMYVEVKTDNSNIIDTRKLFE